MVTRPLTVISYCTPNFRCFAAGLRADCERLGYPLHLEEIDNQFETVIQAFDFKIEFIRDMVRRYDQVLWLDVECRMVQHVPDDWQSPLISTYTHAGRSGFSSGVLMLDRTQLELIELWLKYAKYYPDYPDDFVLDFLSQSLTLDFRTIPFALYDRDSLSPVARGLWKNTYTVIQHPTINRWAEPIKYRRAFNGMQRDRSREEAIARQRKTIFYRNFAGDFAEVDGVMREGAESEYRTADWVFNAVDWTYAPELYWPQLPGDYTTKPRSYAKSREYYEQPAKSTPFRDRAIATMRLDAKDARRYGLDQHFTFRQRARQILERVGLTRR